MHGRYRKAELDGTAGCPEQFGDVKSFSVEIQRSFEYWIADLQLLWGIGSCLTTPCTPRQLYLHAATALGTEDDFQPTAI